MRPTQRAEQFFSGADQIPREGEAEWLNEIDYLGLRPEGLGQRFFAEAHRAESLIIQWAVVHHSRHPGYWASRLGGDLLIVAHSVFALNCSKNAQEILLCRNSFS